MKSARLLVALLNLVLIGMMAYAGIRIFTHTLDAEGTNGFFEELDIPFINDKELNELTTITRADNGPKYTEYQAVLVALAKPPVVEIIPDPDVGDPPPAELNVKVNGVVYNIDSPGSSGVHIEADSVPRFIAVGDSQKISDKLPYHLVDITEDKDKNEYKLIFEDEKGNKKQRTYKKKR